MNVSALFEQQVEKFPNKPAIQDWTRSITYAELNAYANQIAHTILAADRMPYVGTYLDNTIESIAAILGILKSGKAYIPLNPREKGPTTASLIEQSGIQTILTEEKYIQVLPPHMVSIDVATTSQNDNGNPTVDVSLDDHCCVIYTSGSTGEAKGVMQNHRNVLHVAKNYTKQLDIVSEDKILLLPHASFVASMLNMFGSLTNGATIYLYDMARKGAQELPREIMNRQVTVYHSVPTIFLRLVDRLSPFEHFTHIRLVVLGGEPVHQKHLELYKKHFPIAKKFVIVYGATEANGAAFLSTHDETTFSPAGTPIGCPADGFSIEVVDQDRKPLPQGQEGEIRITGKFVSLGYFQNTELTNQSFEAMGAQRTFYTADRGYVDEQGCLFHLGRNDAVVKVSGRKVSLLEIESNLLKYPGINEVVVLTSSENPQKIMAYIVGSGDLNKAEIGSWLSKRLPHVMLPVHLVEVAGMPLTMNGKIDKRALLQEELSQKASYIAPSNSVEVQLVDIWQEVFQQDHVGVNDDFFDMGGDSLLATMVISRVSQELQVDLQMNSFFEAPTIRELAECIRSGHGLKENGGCEM